MKRHESHLDTDYPCEGFPYKCGKCRFSSWCVRYRKMILQDCKGNYCLVCPASDYCIPSDCAVLSPR